MNPQSSVKPSAVGPGKLQRFLRSSWPLLIPALFLIALMHLFPFVWQIQLAFTDLRLGMQSEYVGLSNFRFLFTSPGFLASFGYTFMFMIGTVTGRMVLGLALAIIMDQDLRFRTVYRVLILLPWIVAGVVVGFLFRAAMAEGGYGLLNAWLEPLGLGPVQWRSIPWNARWSVILSDVWRGVGFATVLQLAGLQTVPKDLLECAEIDGAGALRKLLQIKLPMMKDIWSVTLVFTVIGAFDTYEQILVMTGGGPGYATTTMALYMFQTAFGEAFMFGRGAAVGMLLFFVTLIFVLIYVHLTGFGEKRGT